jgi:misacylated tRNA(Ala) deacylase
MMTEELFREDAYLRQCAARVMATEAGWVALDRTVFYARGGGQPGDTGGLRLPDGRWLAVTDTRRDEVAGCILHLAELADGLEPGTAVEAAIDWERRHRLMRMHSCLHLLCRAVDAPVTGGQVDDGKGRLDFDLPEAMLDRVQLTARLMAWIAEDRPIRASWIEEDELDGRPELVRTMSVKPPRGQGRVRLIEIEGLDLQACGGTHVGSTAEIGRVEVTRIEKKGRLNRRVVVQLLD